MMVVYEGKDILAAVCLGLSSMCARTAETHSIPPPYAKGWSAAAI